jgi:hypothetical protein
MADAAYGLWPLVILNTTARFADDWYDYAARTPAFAPRRRPSPESDHAEQQLTRRS